MNQKYFLRERANQISNWFALNKDCYLSVRTDLQQIGNNPELTNYYISHLLFNLKESYGVIVPDDIMGLLLDE